MNKKGSIVGTICAILFLAVGVYFCGFAYAEISMGLYCNNLGDYVVDKVGTTHFNCCDGDGNATLIDNQYYIENECVAGGEIPGWWHKVEE